VRTIVFVHASVTPSKHKPWADRSALLLNLCNGYHAVLARFDGDGEFLGFFDWLDPTPYRSNFYVAWALLPDEMLLIGHFNPKRSNAQGAGMSHNTENEHKEEPVVLDGWYPNWNLGCEVCGQKPTVNGMEDGKVVYRGDMCGVCTFGEAACLDPAEWNK
jgi:hypothetical protein